MYELLNPPTSSTKLGCWAKPVGRYSEVVGYSHLGSIFLRDPLNLEYIILFPLASGNNAKRYGRFKSLDDFETTVLKDPTFVGAVLHPDNLGELQKRLGTLKSEEVYYPIPFPCLGGSGALSSYGKGDVWVFADLIGQIIGVGR